MEIIPSSPHKVNVKNGLSLNMVLNFKFPQIGVAKIAMFNQLQF